MAFYRSKNDLKNGPNNDLETLEDGEDNKTMKFAALIFAGVLFMAIANAQDKPPQSSPSPAASPAASATKPAPPKPTDKPADKPAEKPAEKPTDKPTTKPEASLPKEVKKLVTEDQVIGTGKEATKGKTIKVHYTGWLYDQSKPMGRGQQFDSSIGKDPFSFALGSGTVIKGWDEGFEKMKVGGKRRLIIPSEMGYGKRGAGSQIPPNAPLLFEVELLDVQ